MALKALEHNRGYVVAASLDQVLFGTLARMAPPKLAAQATARLYHMG